MKGNNSKEDLRNRRIPRELSSVGRLLLNSEVETNLSIPCALLIVEGHLTKETCVNLVNERLIPKFSRFSSVVTHNGRVFTPFDAFNCNDHIFEKVYEAENYDKNFIQSKISKIKNAPFAPQKPLWEIHLFYLAHSHKTYMFWRVHHCIADGASLGMVFVVLGDRVVAEKQPAAEVEGKGEVKPTSSPPPRPSSPSRNNSSSAASILSASLQFLLFPFSLIYLLILWLTTLAPALLFARTRLPSIFNAAPSLHKSVGWECVTNLNESKNICLNHNKGSLKPTLNDLMLSCGVGATERYVDYMKSKDNSVRNGSVLTVAIPVNVRKAPITTLGNKVGSYNVTFPLNHRSPNSRILEVTKIMNGRKYVPEPQLINFITYVCSILPQKLMIPIFSKMCSRFCMVVSNVRGPPKTLFYNSLKVTALMGFIPPPNGVPIAIGITSYDDQVYVTLNTDYSVIQHPQILMDYFLEDFKAHCNNNNN